MKIPFLDLKVQYQTIQDNVNAAIADVIHNTSFIGGPIVTEFENQFARFCETEHCIGVGNGTDAIFIALRACNIGAGDEVITVANSFIATSEAITMTGARVVFVDCDPDTYCMDVKLLEAKITARTKAIIPVHLYGYPANMPVLMEIAKKHHLFVIADAAQAHGAKINQQNIAQFGDVVTFSFYPGKNLGAYGDAGAIVTNNSVLAKKMRMFANHGRITKYDHEFEGVNSRLDTLQAAVLKEKLPHLSTWIAKRQHVAQRYSQLLADADVVLPQVTNGYEHAYHLYVVRVKNRDDVMAKLQAEGVSTGIHYPIGLPFLKAYQYLGHQAADFPITHQYQSEIFSLPMFPELTEPQIGYTCEKLKQIISYQQQVA